jgi:hypothetical protein
VGEGGLQLGVVEPLGAQPALVLAGPAGPSAVDTAVPQQQRLQPPAGTASVVDQVGPGAAQIPDRLLARIRDADGDQLAGAVQPRQAAAVTPAAARGISDGAITWQATPWRCSSRASS